MRQSTRLLLIVLALAAVPAVAFAQASITGVVKDASGAVLPGVTVEASSPDLIEKVRTALSDGNGQYRIIDLRPGTYALTFTLPGFSTVKREGIELTGSFAATINADLRVGAIEETITVTGETPIVDIQNVTRQRVMTKEIVETIPNGKYYANLAALIPGMNVASSNSAAGGNQDVGGTGGDAQSQLSIHGSRNNDQRLTINGIPFGEGNGSTHGIGPNTLAMDEVSVDTGAVDASLGQGGVRMNFVPKQGGNAFRGNFFYSGAAASWQANNITPDLKARGATSGNPIEKLYDIAPGAGGPIIRDKLWWYGTWRRNVVNDYVANGFFNKNADPKLGNSNPWTFEKDLSRPIVAKFLFRYATARVTWQATAKNKFSFSYDLRDRCGCPTSTTTVESATNNIFKPMNISALTWSSPLTNRLLMEGGFNYLDGKWVPTATDFVVPGAIQVTETNPLPGNPSGAYRGRLTDQNTVFPTFNSRFVVSYVTGSHSMQVGGTYGNGKNAQDVWAVNPQRPFAYTFTNGVPTQFQVGIYPQATDNRTKADVGLWVQDKWTMGRLTLSGAVRFDYLNTYAAPITLGPAPMQPGRNVSFPETPMLAWKDITPKTNAVLDVFGNGRTAVKVSLNRYVQNQAAGGVGSINLAPVSRMVNSATRSWIDGNGNYVPDCDVTSGALQDNRPSGGDLCGAWTGNNVNFGRSVPSTASDPATQFGWGARPYNWEFSTGVQQGLTSRMSMDVSYFRRIYGNFYVTQNRNVTAADYTSFCVTAPNDSRLPGGGGYQVCGFSNINPAKASAPTDNIQTFAKNIGDQSEHWNGVDVSMNARLGRGILFQGGTSTGRTTTDNCDIQAKLPGSFIATGNNATNGPAGTMPYCHQAPAWLTQFKALGSYMVPKVGVQFSATFQSLPGPQLSANVTYTNAQVQQSLGRPLAGNAQNITLQVVRPGDLYGDRLNQVDLRFGKVLAYGRTRASLSVDLYNALNGNAVTAESSTYSSWRTPTTIIAPRIAKVQVQFDF